MSAKTKPVVSGKHYKDAEVVATELGWVAKWPNGKTELLVSVKGLDVQSKVEVETKTEDSVEPQPKVKKQRKKKTVDTEASE